MTTAFEMSKFLVLCRSLLMAPVTTAKASSAGSSHVLQPEQIDCIQFYVSLYSLLPAYPSLGGCSAACGCARFCCMPLIHPDLITPAFATCMSFSPKVLGRPLPRSLPFAERSPMLGRPWPRSLPLAASPSLGGCCGMIFPRS